LRRERKEVSEEREKREKMLLLWPFNVLSLQQTDHPPFPSSMNNRARRKLANSVEQNRDEEVRLKRG